MQLSKNTCLISFLHDLCWWSFSSHLWDLTASMNYDTTLNKKDIANSSSTFIIACFLVSGLWLQWDYPVLLPLYFLTMMECAPFLSVSPLPPSFLKSLLSRNVDVTIKQQALDSWCCQWHTRLCTFPNKNYKQTCFTQISVK